MGVRFHLHAVDEGTGVALVGVADHVLDGAGGALQKLPFAASGESATAAATDASLLDKVADREWLHGQGAIQPGVGTDRAAVLLETPDARFVAPDNGLLTLVCRAYEPSFADTDATAPTPVPHPCRAWRLTNPDYWRHPVSNTFHGRDVFAPVAAHLSLHASPDALGVPSPTITTLALPIPRPDGNTISGQVIFADAFGNLVTDITTDLLHEIGVVPGDPSITVTIAGHTITGLSRTFHDPPRTEYGDSPSPDPQDNKLRALIGSHGRLEIAVVDGSAAGLLESRSAEIVTAARREE